MAVLKVQDFYELLEVLVKDGRKSYISDTGETVSFGELASYSLEYAGKLYRDFGQGKKIFIPATRSLNFVRNFLSVIASGNIAIPFNSDTPEEVYREKLNKFRPDYVFNNEIPVIKAESGEKIPSSTGLPSLALITSGSGGNLKAALLSQAAVLSNAYAVINSMELANPGKVGITLPLYHSFALVTQLITSLLTGGHIFLLPEKTLPGEVINFISENNLETIAGVPTNLKMWLSGNEKQFSSVKHITVAGAALEVSFTAEIKKAFPNADIWVGYGLTEAGPRVTAISDKDPKFALGSVGKPVQNTFIELSHEEVTVKSPSMMLGYLEDKNSTRSVLRDNWLYTGDLGRIDEDGYLFIRGRKDSIFMSGGKKVSPLCIEKILSKHPLIGNCGVFGKQDAILGNKIVALLVLKEKQPVKVKELKDYCKNFLEPHLIPHEYVMVEELPHTANGKLKRKELPSCLK